MSGIAEYLVKKNYKVSGSDMTLSPITKRLENLELRSLQDIKKIIYRMMLILLYTQLQ